MRWFLNFPICQILNKIFFFGLDYWKRTILIIMRHTNFRGLHLEDCLSNFYFKMAVRKNSSSIRLKFGYRTCMGAHNTNVRIDFWLATFQERNHTFGFCALNTEPAWAGHKKLYIHLIKAKKTLPVLLPLGPPTRNAQCLLCSYYKDIKHF